MVPVEVSATIENNLEKINQKDPFPIIYGQSYVKQGILKDRRKITMKRYCHI